MSVSHEKPASSEKQGGKSCSAYSNQIHHLGYFGGWLFLQHCHWLTLTESQIFHCCLLIVEIQGIETRALCMIGKSSTTELYLGLFYLFFKLCYIVSRGCPGRRWTNSVAVQEVFTSQCSWPHLLNFWTHKPVSSVLLEFLLVNTNYPYQFKTQTCLVNTPVSITNVHSVFCQHHLSYYGLQTPVCAFPDHPGQKWRVDN